jgi:hypothetical protein
VLTQFEVTKCCSIQRDIEMEVRGVLGTTWTQELGHPPSVREVYEHLGKSFPKDPGFQDGSVSHFRLVDGVVQCSVHGTCQ